MSGAPFVAACVQLNPGADRASNIDRAAEAITAAASQGASLILLPEYVGFLHTSGKEMRLNATREDSDPALRRFIALARDHRVWIQVGSLVVATGADKLANRSILLSDTGEVVARYDKIHMFDAILPNGRTIRESSTYAPGGQAVLARTPLAAIGMSICYDVRFPNLYRALAQAGAELLVVPSAFTRATGSMHWKALLQARAIENGAYVLAAATCGEHPGGHATWGHAMIVDPTGRILAEAGESPEVVFATIDPGTVALARSRIPSLSHDRAFDMTTAVAAVHTPPCTKDHEPF